MPGWCRWLGSRRPEEVEPTGPGPGGFRRPDSVDRLRRLRRLVRLVHLGGGCGGRAHPPARQSVWRWGGRRGGGRLRGRSDRRRGGRCGRRGGDDGRVQRPGLALRRRQQPGHLVHGGPVRRVHRQHLQDQGGECLGLPRRHDVAGRNPVEQGHRVLPGPEGRLALERGVQRRAQGEHVGRRGRPAAPGDLGREVRRGARDHAGARERDVAEGVSDPEVGDLGRTVLGDEHVGRLHVTVDDAHLVRRRQRRGHLAADQARPSRPGACRARRPGPPPGFATGSTA